MISVCIATHNGEQFIKEQLDSILCQLAPDDEVVVSDDGSTDRTLDILSAYHDERIKVYHYKQPTKSHRTHLYVTRNFENALRNAKGDFIFLSDQDDRWMPDKIEKCVSALMINGLVIHNMSIADEKMTESGALYYAKNPNIFNNYFMLKDGYYGCTMAFKREILQYILPFPKKLVVHDYWIGMIAEHLVGASFIAEPLILYRYNPISVSHEVQNTICYKIRYRLYTLWHLYLRLLMWKLKSALHL